ncbi:hypothetical protein ASE07_11185 [Noviherbaspirillum sp. Root189]|nr:hypothetical protein ASE07_11185 [Noviherbaspirillum sp. Root189]
MPRTGGACIERPVIDPFNYGMIGDHIWPLRRQTDIIQTLRHADAGPSCKISLGKVLKRYSFFAAKRLV